jgi:ATP-binding cassette subfamily B protein
MFFGPLQFANRFSEWLSRALAAADRVFEILDSSPSVPEPAEPVTIARIDGQVEFKNVSFGYDSHHPVLKNLNLKVKAGEMIGLVGHSGAGKSTTINLLCRLYDVNEGEICIDGIDVRKIRQQDLRSQIGLVMQDSFLFNGSIAENISYSKSDATREEIIKAAKAANAHDFIAAKADGYDTIVGERGNALSGGERQRISIARAILHDPRILVLDEATSAVDTDSEKQIQDAIARLTKGRTTFAIAHRLSTLRYADRLMVFKAGEIEEIGTHDELLEKKGEFHRLVEMQQEMSRIKAIGG